MRQTDLVLLHPPAVYDFRKKQVLFGPISDVVPSTPVFEMYPIGFASISRFLELNGVSVRIINIALKMLKSKSFNVERLISKLTPKLFGIDLHWMPHVHGALEIAKMVKRIHPNIPVILGGLSSSYYYVDIMENYPFVDFVMRGDTTEYPLLMLVKALMKGKKNNFHSIPNLVWRSRNGGDVEVVVNPFSYVPEDIDEFPIDYTHIMKNVVRDRDLLGYVPFTGWVKYPVTAAFTCKGCKYNCKTCGGSLFTFRKIMNRQFPVFKSPDVLAEEVIVTLRHLNAPIMLIGDFLQNGEEYAIQFLRRIAKENIKNQIAFEFFVPPPEEIIKEISRAIPNFNVEISPESHDDVVRKTFGRPYTTKDLEVMMELLCKYGCRRLDVFFMTGLPKQTYQSVMQTADYCVDIMKEYAYNNKKGTAVLPFISPLAPFLDPGSDVFESPDKYGYVVFCKNVQEHYKAMESPTWEYMLNYETKWMNRAQIVHSTYEAASKLNDAKCRYSIISSRIAKRVKERTLYAIKVMRYIEDVVEKEGIEGANTLLANCGGDLANLSSSTVCEKTELEWPVGIIKMKPFRIIKTLLGY